MSIGSQPPPPPPPNLFDDWVRVAQREGLTWQEMADAPAAGLGRLVQTSGALVYLYLTSSGVTMAAEFSAGEHDDRIELLIPEEAADVILNGTVAAEPPGSDVTHNGETYAFHPGALDGVPIVEMRKV